MTGTNRKTRKELKFAHAAKMKAKSEARKRVVLPVYANKTPRIGDRVVNIPNPSPQKDRFVAIPVSDGSDFEKAKAQAAERKKILRQELENILEAKPEFKPSYEAIHRLMGMSDGNPTEGAERRVFLTYDAEPLQDAREIGQSLWDQGGINLMHFALLCMDVRDQAELSASWDKIGEWRA